MPPMCDNIFVPQTLQENQQQFQTNGGLHAYMMNNKAHPGVQTPSNYKQVSMNSNASGVQDNYNFAANDGPGSASKYMGSSGTNNLRAKTMAPSVGFQML